MVNTEIRLIIFFAAKDGEALYSQQKQDQELTVARIMNSLLSNSDLKKVGKTTKPFRYDLNKIPYNYTVEVEDSQFLIIRLMSSLGSLRRRKGSGALKEEIEVWNSQGEGKDKGLFSLYIS